MLTLTTRHRRGAALRPYLAGTMAAFRRLRQGGTIQKLWTRNVTASARALEVTYGANGWHPHLHVALRTPEWSDDDHASLVRRWREVVRSELGAQHDPDNVHGAAWSLDRDGGVSRYLGKLSLEVSGFGKEAGDTVSPWELATRAALHDDEDARARWLEFQAATKGMRAIWVDERARRMAEGVPVAFAPRDESQEVTFEAEREVSAPVSVVELWPEEVRALALGERRMHAFRWHLLKAVESANDPEQTVREWFARYAS